MSEPIPAITTGTPPAASGAAALIALIEMLHTDPVAAPLTESAGFFLNRRGLSIRYNDSGRGVRQMEAARALFGGTVTNEDDYAYDTIRQQLKSTWQGFPLHVHVHIPREDEVAELRKQIAELQAAGAAQAVAE